ncbi:MAG: beta-N-acetylhexosaminidase [Vagococcus sp.]|nr:beta-N-acetylhexosaminidase [Vagococcus sp.]
MKKLNLITVDTSLQTILNHWQHNHSAFSIDTEGFPVDITVNARLDETINVSKDIHSGTISIAEPRYLSRALFLWLTLADKQPTFSYSEKAAFKEVGTMIDCSRNAVPTLDTLKSWVRFLSALGYTQLMLYTEDTYEVPELPYFGHFRGRYTAEEIKELDQYASLFGIELIPCIQTLAHLENALKWFPMSELRDTEDILLVNYDATYEFIEQLIATIAENFTTRRIHIGMDEAQRLGLGRYLEENGYHNRFDIMNQHLTKVMEILNHYHLKPMMWSDMFFRLGSKTGDYYDLDSHIPEEVKDKIPDVEMVYWDYYHTQQAEYETLIKSHQSLERPLIFAGATWTFNGMVPNYSKTWRTTQAALSACKQQNVKEVFCTLWLDDGAETLLETAYPGLSYFASQSYPSETGIDVTAEFFETLFKAHLNDFLSLNDFDCTPGVDKENITASHPAKFSLWQDPLLGLYDGNTAKLSLKDHYEQLTIKLLNVYNKENPLFNHSWQFYQQLARVLTIKADIGKEIRSAYLKKDKKQMADLVIQIDLLTKEVDTLRTYHRDAWFHANKPFGWEVLDIRYGGLIARLHSTLWRLAQWMQHDVAIEELDAERLINLPQSSLDKGNLGRQLYQHIVSPSKLSNV